jgi:hypothetical protein
MGRHQRGLEQRGGQLDGLGGVVAVAAGADLAGVFLGGGGTAGSGLDLVAQAPALQPVDGVSRWRGWWWSAGWSSPRRVGKTYTDSRPRSSQPRAPVAGRARGDCVLTAVRQRGTGSAGRWPAIRLHRCQPPRRMEALAKVIVLLFVVGRVGGRLPAPGRTTTDGRNERQASPGVQVVSVSSSEGSTRSTIVIRFSCAERNTVQRASHRNGS